MSEQDRTRLARFVGRLEHVLLEIRDHPEIDAAQSAGFELWWCAEAFDEARRLGEEGP